MGIDETRWMMQWGDEGTLDTSYVYWEMVKLYVVIGIGFAVMCIV